MSAIGYAIVALSSIFLANAVPHLTRGSAGYLHRVPWRVPASAAENVLWASINLLVGMWLAWWAATYDLFVPVALTVGIIVGGAFLALIGTRFANNPAERGQTEPGQQER